jgi:uncharacterized protein
MTQKNHKEAQMHMLPPKIGIGLKPQHYEAVLHSDTCPDWVEIHPQNYFCDGGPPHRWLAAIAERYPLSFHSVGLSLGSAEGVNTDELERLARLCERYHPACISDHLSFSGDVQNRFADLLPIPYTQASLTHFAGQVQRVQDRLQTAILIENPSRCLVYRADTMQESEFVERLITQTGCGLLLDLNNVEVSAANLRYDAREYVDAVNPAYVGEIHLAGHTAQHHDSGTLLIDDHGSAVSDVTWALFERFTQRAGARPTLIEWDNNIPDYAVLMDEVAKAQAILDKAQVYAGA